MFTINKGGVPEATLEMFGHNEYSYYTRGIANFSVNMVDLREQFQRISNANRELFSV